MQQKKYLTPQDVARLLNIARYRIYEWVSDGQIPYLRTVGRILFDPEEIERWLRRDRDNSNSGKPSKRSGISASLEA